MHKSIPVFILCLMCASCDSGRRADATPSGPFFQLRPIAPRSAEFKGYTTQYNGYQQPVALSPILHPEQQRAFGGVGEGVFPASHGGAPVVYHRGDVVPVEQEVFGGRYADKGDDFAYRVGVGDKVGIQVDEHPEFSGTFEVKQDGSIETLLTYQRYAVEGMTTDEIASATAKILTPYFRSKPMVQVSVDLAISRYYYVFGEVKSQGRFPMGLNNIRVSETVFRANSDVLVGTDENFSRQARLEAEADGTLREDFGNPTYADLRRVYLITPHRSNPQREIVNVKAALLQGNMGGDPYIRPGQIVFVPSSIDGRTVRFLQRVTSVLKEAKSADEESSYWYRRVGGK